MIQVECDCGRVIKTGDENAGKKARCPDCGEVVQLPSPRRSTASKSATSKSTSASNKTSAKSAKRRPPEDEEFDDGALEDEEEFDDEFDDEDDDEPVARRSKSKLGASKKSSAKKGIKGKSDPETPKKKKKTSSEDDAELNKKILIGTGIAVGLVVLGLVIFLIMKMPAGGGGKVEVPQNFVAFSSQNGEITCEAPKDWPVVTGGGQGGVPPHATFENGGVKISFRSSPSGASFQMMAQAGGKDDSQLPDELKPVSQVHDTQKRKFQDEMSGYQEQGNPAMIKTKGFGEGRISEFTANVGFGKVYGYRVTLLGTINQWNCVCTCSASQWKAYQPVFRRVIESAGGS